jgi:exodeoxyribonuclease V gamma subunit
LFTIYHSNDVSVLKSLVVELMQRSPLEGVFAQETVLVQSPGMSQWLKLKVAEHFGIAANIDFPLPATFIWNIFKQVLGDVPDRSAFSKDQMTWRLLGIIPNYLDAETFSEHFSELKTYLEDDESQIKLYQLSARVADIFDQYLMYRPGWINTWESDQLVEELKGEDIWQATLWQALVKETLASGASRYHRANLYDDCIDALNRNQCPKEIKALKRIFVFGVTALPPRYLDVLNALGQHIDVHFMLSNPCQYYWGDILDQKYLAKQALKARSNFHSGQSKPLLKATPEEYISSAVGNSLLASWGKVGRDMQRLLAEYPVSQIEAFVESEAQSLLASIQQDMLVLNDRLSSASQSSKKVSAISKTDTSLQVSVCHSPMREVQVLHDYILGVMSADSSLQPRDIVVMVSDIDTYSPYINAVFSSQTDQNKIPYSISDLSSNHYHSVIQAFIWLLGTPQHRFTSKELLSFIQVPAVMATFGFTEEGLDVITHWVQQAGIRWGLDQHTAERFELPEMESNTWLFGLNRMLAGYAMQESMGVVDGVLPYEQIQGMNAELAGQLAHLVQKLMRLDEVWHNQGALSIDQWKLVLEQLRDDFFSESNEDDARQLQQVSRAIESWYEQVASVCVDDSTESLPKLTADVMLEVMSEKLIQERVSQRFLAGQLNFCTLMPMRSVPFKVVCLLGMDGNAYPRQQPPLGFDLMHGRFQYGDRSRREDDRYLFLEAVLAAEASLYISYTGRSIRDNSDIIPSVLVSELLDYCVEGFVLEGSNEDNAEQKLLSHLVREYPMIPYHTDLYSAHTPTSFDTEWLSVIEHASQPTLPFLSESLPRFELNDHLEVSELKRFWSAPVDYFFHKRLKVFLGQTGDEIQEDELFELDGLQQYLLKDSLLEQAYAARSESQSSPPTVVGSSTNQYIAEGRLPIAAFGDLALEENMTIAEQLADYLTSFADVDKEHPVELSYTLVINDQNITLQGWLDNWSEQGFINHRVGRIRTKDTFSCWIEHLINAALGNNHRSHFIGYNNKDGSVEHLYLMPVNQIEARSYLEQLVTHWLDGLSFPLLFSTDIAQSYVDKLNDPKSDEDRARTLLTDEIRGLIEGNEYVSRCFIHLLDPESSFEGADDARDHLERITDEFIGLVETLYQPMIKHLKGFEEESA